MKFMYKDQMIFTQSYLGVTYRGNKFELNVRIVRCKDVAYVYVTHL